MNQAGVSNLTNGKRLRGKIMDIQRNMSDKLKNGSYNYTRDEKELEKCLDRYIALINHN